MDDRELYHYGVLGMKWGVRRTAAQLGHQIKQRKADKKRKANLEKARVARAEKKKAEEERQKKLAAGKLKVKDMTDAELQAKINRLEMEKKYSDLKKSSVQSTRGKKFVDKFLDSSSDKLADNVAADLLAQTVKSVGAKGVNQFIDSLNGTVKTDNKFERVYANNKKKS